MKHKKDSIVLLYRLDTYLQKVLRLSKCDDTTSKEKLENVDLIFNRLIFDPYISHQINFNPKYFYYADDYFKYFNINMKSMYELINKNFKNKSYRFGVGWFYCDIYDRELQKIRNDSPYRYDVHNKSLQKMKKDLTVDMLINY